MSKKASKKKAAAKRPAAKAARPSAKAASRGSKAAGKARAGKAAGGARGGSKPGGAPGASVLVDRAAGFFDFAVGVTTKYAEPFNQSNATAQPMPTSNHALWNLGHLAISNLWFASLIDGRPVGTTDAHEQMFGSKSKPVNDPNAYPPYAEVKGLYDQAARRLREAVRAESPAGLLAPCETDSHGFCTDKLDAVLKAAWHEGWHLGQIAELRKALGLVPAKA
ncbi:MAG: DinB family protein [Planctomycetota bacterium]|nr:DinB family protein [Planctomycetota bacterium]